MKKLIFQLLIFGCFSTVFYVVGLFVLAQLPNSLHPNLRHHPGSGGFLYSRLKEVKTQNNIDLLILGSSHAYRGFDTRIFNNEGINAFNLGSSAQTPVQTNYLLKTYLKQLKPKVVLYEVYPETFTFDGVEAEMDLISNEKLNANFVETLFHPFNFRTINSAIYSTFHSLYKSNTKYIEPVKKDDLNYVKGGYVEYPNKIKKDTILHPKQLLFKSYQFDHFIKNCELLTSAGVKTILVYAPICKTLKGSYTNENQFYSFLKKLNLPLWDFSLDQNLTKDHFFIDLDHLNQTGVKEFNKTLLLKLKDQK